MGGCASVQPPAPAREAPHEPQLKPNGSGMLKPIQNAGAPPAPGAAPGDEGNSSPRRDPVARGKSSPSLSEPPPQILMSAAENGSMPKEELVMALKILGLVKGPLAGAMKTITELERDGRIDVDKWWFELRLEPRYRAIISSKARISRPDGWDIRHVMKVAKAFDASAATEGCATIGREHLRCVLEGFGLESEDVEAGMAAASGDEVHLGEWKSKLVEASPYSFKAIVEEVDVIVDVPEGTIPAEYITSHSVPESFRIDVPDPQPRENAVGTLDNRTNVRHLGESNQLPSSRRLEVICTSGDSDASFNANVEGVSSKHETTEIGKETDEVVDPNSMMGNDSLSPDAEVNPSAAPEN